MKLEKIACFLKKYRYIKNMNMKNKKNVKTRFKKWWKKKKESVIGLAILLIFIVLFILLMISASNKWNEYIQNSIMALMLVFSVVATIFPLVKQEKVNCSEIIMTSICFLFLIAAIIVFASVATDPYKEPVIQISSSITGGLIALYGVGMTIKENRLVRREDEIKKAKPNIFPIGEQTWKTLIGTTKLERNIEVQFELSNLKAEKGSGDNSYCFAPIYLANSDLSMCVLKGILINEKYYVVFKYDLVLLRGSANCFKLDYCFKMNEEINSIHLIVGDMLANIYGCLVSYDFEPSKKKKSIQICVMGTLKIESLDKKLPDVFDD